MWVFRAVSLILLGVVRPATASSGEEFFTVRRSSTDGEPRAEDYSEDPYVFSTLELPQEPRYMPPIANGHLATVPTTETVYVNGVYNGYKGESHRAKIPSSHKISIEPVGVELPVQESYHLDTKRGHFRHERTYEKFSITHYQIAHQFISRMLINLIEIKSLNSENQVVSLDATFTEPQESADLLLKSTTQLPPEWQHNPAMKCYLTKEVEDPRYQDYTHTICSVWDTNMVFNSEPNTVLVEASEPAYLMQFSIYDTFPEKVQQMLALVRTLSPKELLETHEEHWTQRMNSMTIDVEGDLQLAKVIHGSIYYILTSLPPQNDVTGETDPFYGLSPGSLAYGDYYMDYQGHSFWDTETWMFPSYVLFDPKSARATLNYRVAHMAAAADRAAETGYEGARFPWESGFTGAEVTPDCCPETRDNQQHITADIAFAARQYLALTNDINWLTTPTAGPNIYDTGCSLLVDGIGKFWLSRVDDLNPVTKTYDILNVMPPDEDHRLVNNSVYTNVAAGFALHTAKYAACLCGMETENDPFFVALDAISKSISLPYDQEAGFHPEFDGYQIGEPIKQADAVLLGFPLGYEMPRDVRKKDLEIYEEVVRPDGPAMTWSMHAIGWMELGEWDRAEVMFNKSYQAYFREPFKVWTEAQEGLGAINFITGMGGFLQAVLYGYGGIRIKLDRLEFDPKLPPGVTSMTLQGLKYRGNTFTVRRDQFGTVFSPIDLSGETLFLQEFDAIYVIDNYSDIRLGSVPFSLFTDVVSSCPLPDDIIGIPVEEEIGKFVRRRRKQPVSTEVYSV